MNCLKLVIEFAREKFKKNILVALLCELFGKRLQLKYFII